MISRPPGDFHTQPVAVRAGRRGARPFVTAASQARQRARGRSPESRIRIVKDDTQRETDVAREALSDLQESLDAARRLIEETRLLLSGEAPPDEVMLIVAPEDQAAAPSPSERVQKPSGE